jgi:hypothetical protein
MPNFTFKRRKSEPLTGAVPQTEAHPEQHPENPLPSPHKLSAVDKKIHPDLNLLAEELESPLGHDRVVDVSPISQRTTTTDEADFASLPPSVQKNRASINTHLRALSDGMKQGPSKETSQADLRSVRTTSTRRKPFRGQPLFTGVTSKNSPSLPSPSSAVASPPSPGGRWSAFGRKTAYDTPTNNQYDNEPYCRDSLSRRSIQSRATSRSRGSTDTEPRTPRSFAYSQYNSTQQSFSSQVFENNSAAPSPGTFGIPTPSSLSGVTFGSSKSSRVGNQAGPPPLPPLDHPAFHTMSTGQPLISQALKDRMADATQGRYRSQSLPSLAPSSSHSSRMQSAGFTKRMQNVGKRESSIPKTSSHEISSKNEKPMKESASSKIWHSRATSKSSLGSSRRSSAEYSAKKASSTGHGGENEQCWEVQVSQEMLRLALDVGGGQLQNVRAPILLPNRDINASGKARSDNVGSSDPLQSPLCLLTVSPSHFFPSSYLSIHFLILIFLAT